ncbi:hypothetical protein NW767_011330 [Fusarium falciforme]|nr:hypothetical protein NW767_011330 [Fusarium falciforme]
MIDFDERWNTSRRTPHPNANTNTNTNTKNDANDINFDETWVHMDTSAVVDNAAVIDNAAVMKNATGTEENTDLTDRCLPVTNGELQYWDKSGCPCPTGTMPEVIKQWLKDECRDTRKKDEWINWLMEAPLDPRQFGGACMTPYNDIASPEGLKSAVGRSLDDLNHMYADMETFKAERNKRLDEALQLDFNYRSAKRDVEWYTMVIMRSLEKDGET